MNSASSEYSGGFTSQNPSLAPAIPLNWCRAMSLKTSSNLKMLDITTSSTISASTKEDSSWAFLSISLLMPLSTVLENELDIRESLKRVEHESAKQFWRQNQPTWSALLETNWHKAGCSSAAWDSVGGIRWWAPAYLIIISMQEIMTCDVGTWHFSLHSRFSDMTSSFSLLSNFTSLQKKIGSFTKALSSGMFRNSLYNLDHIFCPECSGV